MVSNHMQLHAMQQAACSPPTKILISQCNVMSGPCEIFRTLPLSMGIHHLNISLFQNIFVEYLYVQERVVVKKPVNKVFISEVDRGDVKLVHKIEFFKWLFFLHIVPQAWSVDKADSTKNSCGHIWPGLEGSDALHNISYITYFIVPL